MSRKRELVTVGRVANRGSELLEVTVVFTLRVPAFTVVDVDETFFTVADSGMTLFRSAFA